MADILKTYIKASIKGTSTTPLDNNPPYIYTFTGTGTSNSGDLAQALKFAFSSLISPLIENIDPNLNPEVTYKVKTIIEVIITMTVKLPDPDGDNAFIIIPFTFPASSADLPNSNEIEFGSTQVAGATYTNPLTSTSASILAELGVLNLVLQKLIPQLIYEITGIGNAGLEASYCQESSDGCSITCSNYNGSNIFSTCNY